MHIKKSSMPKTWPIARKGKRKRFVAVPSHGTKKGITILYILRDILKIAKTRKEAQQILHNGDVKINTVVRTRDSFPVQVFGTISIDKMKQHYRLVIVNKKFKLQEISEKEAAHKIIKIRGKTVLGKDTIQMNLEDGTNMITTETFKAGDSVIFDLNKKKIENILPLKQGATVEIIAGKHAGQHGEIVDFKKLLRGTDYVIKLEDGTTVNLPFRTILVIK